MLLHADGRAYSNAHFGSGSGPIFLDDVQCTSSARKLLECYSKPILSHNCLHSDDAGVGCEGIFCRKVFFNCSRHSSADVDLRWKVNTVSQCQMDYC